MKTRRAHLSTIDFDRIVGSISPASLAEESSSPFVDAEIRRLARGWRRTLELIERIRRREAGLRILELLK